MPGQTTQKDGDSDRSQRGKRVDMATEEQGAQGADPKTFTQEEVDAMMGKVRREERGKYADYEEIKSKAAKLEEIEEAAKTEHQKAVERAEKAEAELKRAQDEAARQKVLSEVSEKTGVPASLLNGSTREELEASAEAISAFVKSKEPGYPQDKGGAASAASDDDVSKIANPVERVRARAAIISKSK